MLATSVGAHLNQSKGDDDAAEWLPPHKPAVCGYVKTYVAAKAEWNLSVDEAEKEALIDVAQGCRGSTEPTTGPTTGPTTAPTVPEPHDPELVGLENWVTSADLRFGTCSPPAWPTRWRP